MIQFLCTSFNIVCGAHEVAGWSNVGWNTCKYNKPLRRVHTVLPAHCGAEMRLPPYMGCPLPSNGSYGKQDRDLLSWLRWTQLGNFLRWPAQALCRLRGHIFNFQRDRLKATPAHEHLHTRHCHSTVSQTWIDVSPWSCCFSVVTSATFSAPAEHTVDWKLLHDWYAANTNI